MGQSKSKAQKKAPEKHGLENESSAPEIPRDSPWGWMLKNWGDYPRRRKLPKEKMIYYCVEVWRGKEISEHLFWPVFGSWAV